jgi:uncharacterized protein YbjT (DUF2867 family)
METRRKIAVAGATGRLGHHLVEVLTADGHDVVPMSRATGVDIVSGEGLAAALPGVECIIDAATGPSPDQEEATAFFTSAARNLQEAGDRAGVKRIIVVSIIGIDGFTAGYSAAKLAHEQATLSGPIAVDVVRAAQFHEFVAQLVDWGRQGDVSYVQEMRTQPVAARSLAAVLAGMATNPDASPTPGGATPFLEVAGPREESLVKLARMLTVRRGDPVRIEGVSDPSDPDSHLSASGALLPGPGAVLTGPTFEAWLDTAS